MVTSMQKPDTHIYFSRDNDFLTEYSIKGIIENYPIKCKFWRDRIERKAVELSVSVCIEGVSLTDGDAINDASRKDLVRLYDQGNRDIILDDSPTTKCKIVNLPPSFDVRATTKILAISQNKVSAYKENTDETMCLPEGKYILNMQVYIDKNLTTFSRRFFVWNKEHSFKWVGKQWQTTYEDSLL